MFFKYTIALGQNEYPTVILRTEMDNETIYPGEQTTLRITIEAFDDLQRVEVGVSYPSQWFLIVNSKEELGDIAIGKSRTVDVNIEASRHTTPGNYRLECKISYIEDNLPKTISDEVDIIVKEHTTNLFEQVATVVSDLELYIGLIGGFFSGIFSNRALKLLSEYDKRKQLKRRYLETSGAFIDNMKAASTSSGKKEILCRLAELMTILKEIKDSFFSKEVRGREMLLENKLNTLNTFIDGLNATAWDSFIRDHNTCDSKVPLLYYHKLLKEVLIDIEELRNQW